MILARLLVSPLLAWSIQEIVQDRSRLIQVSVVIVALGISLLFWRK
jgi:hypothetical protein